LAVENTKLAVRGQKVSEPVQQNQRLTPFSFLILNMGNGGVIHADADASHNAGEAAGWVTR